MLLLYVWMFGRVDVAMYSRCECEFAYFYDDPLTDWSTKNCSSRHCLIVSCVLILVFFFELLNIHYIHYILFFFQIIHLFIYSYKTIPVWNSNNNTCQYDIRTHNWNEAQKCPHSHAFHLVSYNCFQSHR